MFENGKRLLQKISDYEIQATIIYSGRFKNLNVKSAKICDFQARYAILWKLVKIECLLLPWPNLLLLIT